MRGKFITIEGGEGAGKSTNIAYLAERIAASGIEVVTTREPGGTRIGEELRELLLRPREQDVDPMAELLMIFAARAQHLTEVVIPALDSGRWVISDRFTDATYAYQGAGRELGEAPVAALEQLVQGELRPDLTIILDLPVDVGMERANGRAELDRFEQERNSFFERVRQCYLTRAADNPHRYCCVDASRPLDSVREQLDSVIERLVRT